MNLSTAFFKKQENQSKAKIKHPHFTFTDSYEDYFEWLVHSFKGNEDKKHDVLTNTNFNIFIFIDLMTTYKVYLNQ